MYKLHKLIHSNIFYWATIIFFIMFLLLLVAVIVSATTYNLSLNFSDLPLNFNFTFAITDINYTMLNVTQHGDFLVNYYNITFTNNITDGQHFYSINLSQNFSAVGNFTNVANFSYLHLGNLSFFKEEQIVIGVNVFNYNISLINETNQTNETQPINETNETQPINESEDDSFLFNDTVTLIVEQGVITYLIPDISLPFNTTDTRTLSAPNGTLIIISCEQFLICPTSFVMPQTTTQVHFNITITIPLETLSGNYTSHAFFTLLNEKSNLTYKFEILRGQLLPNLTFENLTAEERIQLLKDLVNFVNRGIIEAENRTRIVNVTIINETIIPVTTYDFSFQAFLEKALLQSDTNEKLAEDLQLVLQLNSQNRDEFSSEKQSLLDGLRKLNKTLGGQITALESEKKRQLELVQWGILGFFIVIGGLALAYSFFNLKFKESNIYRKGIWEQNRR